MTEIKFPNETTEYRHARIGLLKAEVELKLQIERVAAMRRKLPLGGTVREDYVFEALDRHGKAIKVRLSKLFQGDKDTLFLYGFMYGPKMEKPCPMCSSLLDGLNGNAHHIMQRINFAVVARSPIQRMIKFAKARGWDALHLLSSANNSYHLDYFAEDEEGQQMPMANVFVRRNGAIHHFWGTELLYADAEGDARHMDLMWPLWNVLDTTPGGRGDWYPPLPV
ncbi:MAG: DUF899 family protein [Gammaproteobacteria bacterium]|nr:DUF899 family protein [Gammaproteobacteria bacterium]